MRYAEGTSVSVEQSRGEITGILAKHGVLRQAWASEPAGDTLQFELDGRAYRFVIPRPTTDDIFAMYPNHRDTDAKTAQEWRRRWRAQVLLLKAKLEFAAGDGPSTIQRELLAYAVLKDGRTMEEAVSAGSMPLLLASGR